MATPGLYADAFADIVIASDRLVLRRPMAADVAALAKLADDRTIAENTARVPHPYGLADAEAFVAATTRPGAAPALLAFRADAPHVLVGAAGFDGQGAVGDGELGYWVGAPFRGRGYATEMARALVDLAFEHGATKLGASCRVTNEASRRVLQKCGFQWRGVGLVRSVGFGGAFPADRFMLDRRTWQSLRAWGGSHIQTRTGDVSAAGAGDVPDTPERRSA
jgi:RimJ/RimL family protein N-acetyltransferase